MYKKTPTKPPSDPRHLIVLPNEVADLGLEYVRALKAEYEKNGFVGVPWLIPALKDKVNNANKGDLVLIVARPGGGKTSLLMAQLRMWANTLPSIGRPNEVAVLVTAEQQVEAVNSYMMAAGTGVKLDIMANGRISDADLRKMEDWSRERATLPLVIIGKAASRKSARLDLTPESIDACLTILKNEHGLLPSMVGVDYLQRLTLRPDAENKAVAVGELVEGMKNLALNHSCSVWLTAQARREADRNDPPGMPGQDDTQWSSTAEQAADAFIAVARPGKYKRDGDKYSEWEVTRDLYVAVVQKQRWGDAGIWVPMRFDPALNKFSEYEEDLVERYPHLDPLEEEWEPEPA